MTDEFRKSFVKAQLEAYDSGVSDGLETLKDGFTGLKKRGFESFSIEEIIEMVNVCKQKCKEFSVLNKKIDA